MEYIDLRDLEGEELEVWKKALEEAGVDFEGQKENEPTFIPESEWHDYAWDMANDVFGIDLDKGNFSAYFDDERWADDLKMDYSEIEVDGTTYYYRNY